MDDPFDLTRFLDAQEGVFDIALAEIRKGRKQSHWMWFVFPQMRGLGTSLMAHRYGLSSLDEARAYLKHPILSARLIVIVEALQPLQSTSAAHIFGSVDAVKLRSSLTIFCEADGGPLLEAALQRWFDGRRDCATLAIIRAQED